MELNPVEEKINVDTIETPLVQVKNLSKTFVLGKSVLRQALGKKPEYLRAVYEVDLAIKAGECLGLVGESGCGKTTLGRCILRLYEPDKGEVLFEGKNFLEMKGRDVVTMRSKMQVVFQDPYSSLNPRQKVGRIVGEPNLVHHICSVSELDDRVKNLLNTVGLGPDIAERYPHSLSGGQRQRVGLARALAVNPKFIVADEPVSALDVSIQAQVINLLMELREKYQLAMMFITHDLRLVQHVSDRVAVMYLGSIVELAPARDLFILPLHPYSQALLAAAPVANPRKRKKAIAIAGEPPNPINIPPGCPFRPRCPLSFDRCAVEFPRLEEKSSGHFVSCFAVK
ncbi:MAG: ABC transporter ATP-binding protein [Chloroflexi bacterium]|nr:ABC transporter ATP-binding protein [Chloroflexota bacterium]